MNAPLPPIESLQPLRNPKYHKIQSLWKRDPDNNHKTFLEGEFSLPEFSCLVNADWEFTEKVDGTNIRVWNDPDGNVQVGGRTDQANLHKDLLANIHDRFKDLMTGACLYGEGFGAGIQKGGGRYQEEKGFVLFDAWLGHHWMGREELESFAEMLGCQIAPVIGRGSLTDMVDMVRHGLKSRWGDFLAEGIVARPAMELRRRNGDRIITKIKCRDFGVTN